MPSTGEITKPAEDWLRNAHTSSPLQQVNIHGTELVGFSIAYGHHHVHFDPRIHAAIAPHVAEYVYYEQLCIAPEWAHRGVGSTLMSQLLESSSPLPVVDEIARYPLNTASVNLHIKFGFKPLFDLTRHDGIITTIWILEPRAR
jgi:ribosomal protein S18 acetylase RimI-like enzyme